MLHDEALKDFRTQREQLLSDNWWATSSGPVVTLALEVQYDTLKNVFAAVIPGGGSLEKLDTFSSESGGKH